LSLASIFERYRNLNVAARAWLRSRHQQSSPRQAFASAIANAQARRALFFGSSNFADSGYFVGGNNDFKPSSLCGVYQFTL